MTSLKQDCHSVFNDAFSSIAKVENIVIRPYPKALVTIVEVFAASAGLWGYVPPVDAERWVSLATAEEYAKNFFVWQSYGNQQFALETGWHAKLGSVVFAVDASLPHYALTPLFADIFKQPHANSDAEVMCRILSEHIATLGWVYVVPNDEYDISMICVTDRLLEKLQTLMRMLRDEQREMVHLEADSGNVLVQLADH